jgi:hypothetical protein
MSYMSMSYMFVNGHSETIESCKYAIQVQPVAVVSESQPTSTHHTHSPSITRSKPVLHSPPPLPLTVNLHPLHLRTPIPIFDQTLLRIPLAIEVHVNIRRVSLNQCANTPDRGQHLSGFHSHGSHTRKSQEVHGRRRPHPAICLPGPLLPGLRNWGGGVRGNYTHTRAGIPGVRNESGGVCNRSRTRPIPKSG